MATVRVFLFVGKQYKDGQHPVMLRITKDRKNKYISLGLRCKENEWDKGRELFKKNHENYRRRNLIIANHKKRAHSIIDGFYSESKDFTLRQFEREFKGEKIKRQVTVHELLQERIEDLKSAKKIGNAGVYRDMGNSFFKFVKDKELSFPDIDVELLEKYETYLRSRGGSDGGIAVKMRTMRALYNYAIKTGYAKQEDYPFRNYEISKLKGTGIKRALSREEIRMIENFPIEDYPYLINARNYFVFSYFTRGMNFLDMMKLRWSDIIDNRIAYVRSKTSKPFVIKVIEPIQEILDYYKDLPNPTGYVFPILLHDNLEEYQIQHRKKKKLRHYNQNLKEIAQILGIKKNLTSYVARHSFATNLKHAGVSISIISESLGHANLEVTETYLKAFENEVIDEATERLLL